jgi:hypothetical protein
LRDAQLFSALAVDDFGEHVILARDRGVAEQP